MKKMKKAFLTCRGGGHLFDNDRRIKTQEESLGSGGSLYPVGVSIDSVDDEIRKRKYSNELPGTLPPTGILFDNDINN
jgi:hypothetical protein